MSASPLLHGQKTDTPLDRITERLYFLWPLTRKQIEWLNTTIYNRYPFWINYWSFTHVGWGIIWALLRYLTSSIGGNEIFTLGGLLIFHTLFEIWELWAGGYLSKTRALDFPEFVDVVMDTLFSLVGFGIASLFLFPKVTD